MRRFTLVTVALSTTVAFLVGLIIAGGFSTSPIVSSAPRSSPFGGVAARAGGLPAPGGVVNFADIAERINAAVVNIDSASKGREPRLRRPDDMDTPRDFDGPRQGSGSGFIIDREGYILTNNHVIDGAERITVTVADGRAFRAEVVGVDPDIDVALLRIPGARDLPEAPLGNSDDLRVGEWVCAIGNPLGYVHSVTVGVVSFIGRKLFDASLDDYIQTDAAINFGNSGGPLINTGGQVIGINSAISSRASNIGFAVPINQAVAILPQLKTAGHVSRGYIGIYMTDVTPAFQRSLNLGVTHGALVQELRPRSPAERAGLQPYDVIVEVDGRQVITNEELIRYIAARRPGSVSRLEVVRDGRHHTVPVKLAERPLHGEGIEADGDDVLGRAQPRPAEPSSDVPLGISVREMDRTFTGRMDVPDTVQGVIVTRVDPTGSAFSALKRGMVIMEINRRPVRSVSEYQRIVSAARPGDVLAIFYFDPQSNQRALVAVTVD